MEAELAKGKKYKRKSRKVLFGIFIFLFITAVTIGSSYYSYNYVMDSNNKNDKENETEIVINTEDGISVEIPMGSGTAAIADILQKKGLIKSPKIFKILSKINGYDGTYKSGTHIVEKGVNYNSMKGYEALMRILSSKPQDNPSMNVTIPEGFTYKQTVDLLSQKKLINIDNFNQIANNEKYDYEFLKGIPSREFRLEGYLFPETYAFDLKGGEKEIIDRLLEQFNKEFPEDFYKRAKELNMTVDQVITMASIIEREAKVPEEREIISGVFYNRMRSKDKALKKLQSCATIQYILFKRDGKVKEIITLDDEKIDDPYNTYMYEGLPPGPICSPGRDSIIAALYPEEHDYLYFVLKEDGTGSHYFSKTYNEHVNAQNRAQKNKK